MKVLSQYATFGAHDFVNFVEASDNKTVARLSVELDARGAVEPVVLRTISLSEFTTTAKPSYDTIPFTKSSNESHANEM